ncbi:MAG: HD domain-containing protein [Fimbriimonadaceae bacterium]|nr:HD domain-containing protein [Fimbriimonadaceae bacterium]
MTLLHRATLFAAEAHPGQDRDGEAALPYLHHPLEVARNLRWVAGVTDPEMLAAALLHDVVEETGRTLEELEDRFGTRVAGLVRELTRTEPSAEQTEGLSRDEVRELRSRMLLEEIARMSPEAQIIKLCDRLSNLEEAGWTRSEKRYRRYVKQSRRFLEIIPRTVNPPAWDRLRQEIAAASAKLQQ